MIQLIIRKININPALDKDILVYEGEKLGS